ncbi:type IV secretory system conjugative DNA transfer family protein [Streptomyces sp. AC1-42W]|uniref:type IV secretory system conjugative DNA transfer family protein n=1 Tax=Streptomyces sp. AC1-42W TaxID=2218666 RepID=UPI000DACBFB2|nr:type IV secretory system conjugative DNA transfer family protein [Streptomyces sp. AC1-42W]PZT75592.1 type VI secretion protein [Streptomyces sp. AC1-42W]
MAGSGGATSGDGKGGGIPDGLLIGLLVFLLGLTLMAWTATGLAGLFAHGAWPEGVTLTETPLALRRLLDAPHDLPAAWPNTPPAELSGYGLFWGLLIGELMVLAVLSIFVMGVITRSRAVLAHRRTERTERLARHEQAFREQRAQRRLRQSTGRKRGRWNKEREYADEQAFPEPAPEPTDPFGKTAPDAPGPAPVPAPPVPTEHSPETAPVPQAQTQAQALPHPAAPHPPPAAVPAPRTPLVLYGPAPTRRATALQAIHEADGPVLVVTADPSLWAETKDARAKLGPVLVYDPGHLCDTPDRLHWAPTTGCEDADRAASRAAALLAPVRPQGRTDAATADTAETLLRCWLHAAAIDGRPFRQVHRWAGGGNAHEPVRLLRTHPKAAPGLAGLLESALTGHPERREMAQELTVRAFVALSSVHVRDACTPNRADTLALDSFAAEGGSLYVVGESIETPRTGPGTMPLLTALASDVVEHGRRMAARSSDGRLDPPMTLVLDDIAAVAPLPRLPELLRTGQTRGLDTVALLRSPEQARSHWTQQLRTPSTL